MNSKCAAHYEFNLSFPIPSPPSPLPLGKAEALDCCCGKLGPNKYDALLLLVFFLRYNYSISEELTWALIQQEMLVGVLYFPRFDISLNDLHIKRPGSWFVSVTDVLVISESDSADSPLPGLRITLNLQFSITLQLKLA